MKKLVKTVKWIGIIILAIILILVIIMSARGINSIKYRIDTETGIRQETYATLNGAEQFIIIRGHDRTNPVILFLHGGHGSAMSAPLRTFRQIWRMPIQWYIGINVVLAEPITGMRKTLQLMNYQLNFCSMIWMNWLIICGKSSDRKKS